MRPRASWKTSDALTVGIHLLELTTTSGQGVLALFGAVERMRGARHGEWVHNSLLNRKMNDAGILIRTSERDDGCNDER